MPIRSVVQALPVLLLPAILALSLPFGFANAATPVCESPASDPDGDGWGWENKASCIVAGGSADSDTTQVICQTESDPDGDGWGWENNRSCRMDRAAAVVKQPAAPSGAHPQCRRHDSDSDGDGYGWENGASCSMGAGVTTPGQAPIDADRMIAPRLQRCTTKRSDPDRDGLGWENNDLCASEAGLTRCDATIADPDGDGFGIQAGKTCIVSESEAVVAPVAPEPAGRLSPADITDVVLVTGQSNVLGSMTAYNAQLDQPHKRVFAWTSEGWQQADLHQVWDRNGHPGNFSQGDSSRQPYNNFAFHFGRELARLGPERVPAFIVASAPGKGIAHWDRDGSFYREVSEKVSLALRALPHRSHIDGILWHQGESDWQFHGTSDPHATISAGSADYRDYYRLKLQALIANFRAEPWSAGRQTVFICGETRRAAGVNRHLMALNQDTDPFSGCVAATDLPARADDSDGSHFSAAGLREIGIRYARLYQKLRRD